MKKYILLALLSVFAISISAQTEKGEQAVVVNTGFQTNAKRFLLGAQYRYVVFDNFRIAPEATFFFPKNKVMGFDAALNLHYTIEIAYDQMYAYPLIGFTMQNNRYMGRTINGVKDKAKGYTDFAFNLGGGYAYNLKDNLFLNGELKYLFGDNDCFVISLGVGFKF